ncbi:two-component system nitrogen regulation sensor histidine kinase NtrY [Sphingomonas sp. UYAg733]
MGYSAHRLARLVSVTGWRLLLAGCLVAGVIRMIAAEHYAVALVLGSACTLTMLDLWRHASGNAGAVATSSSIAPDTAGRLEQALALIDAVTVALFLIDPDGRVRFANRAARALAGFEPGRLQDMPLLGEVAATSILSLPVGGRQLVSLVDGRSMLVWVGSLSTSASGQQRLISMQAISGELDAVQVGAWHMMTRVLAHEMMNSLTPIASLAESLGELIAKAGRDSRMTDAASTIVRRSQHLMRFVERYRAVVDLPDPHLEEMDVTALLNDIDRLVGADLRTRGIAFAVAPTEPGLHVLADPALIEQAVINLIKNASEAVSRYPDARIGLAATRARAFVTISVVDNGIGVAIDRLEEIFVPFCTTKSGGAGIGLTLARQVALAHGGRLLARHAGDRGLKFELTLSTVGRPDATKSDLR